MKKHIAAANEYRKATMSLANLKARAFRMLTTTFGYWVGLEAISAEMNWADFGTAIFKPVALFGLMIILLGAGSTGGSK